jgi:TRAP-type C4-dicarboxylate transport system permease large subunit
MSETLLVGGMTFLVILGALLYSRFIALTGLPKEVANLIVSAEISIYWIVVLLAFLYIFLGCFMDSISMLLVTMPVILPALNTLKVDLIWFGIIFVKLVEIGAITPPFGISVYALSGVVGKDIPITDIFRGIWWFLLMEFVTLAILIAFPEISLFLPRTMMGP